MIFIKWNEHIEKGGKRLAYISAQQFARKATAVWQKQRATVERRQDFLRVGMLAYQNTLILHTSKYLKRKSYRNKIINVLMVGRNLVLCCRQNTI